MILELNEEMGLENYIYSIATGSKRLRTLLTPVGLAVFLSMLLLVTFGSLYMDSVLGLPKLFLGSIGIILGMILLIAGLIICGWCVVWFIRAKGTPVPINPPQQLITRGPYAWSRNPMVTGVFGILFGIGFLLHSVSMVCFWTPVFVALNILELKLIEEPELERRFGAAYKDYKRQIPMFIPRIPSSIDRK